MTTCSSCGGQTLEGNFCIRCGAPLGPAFLGQSRGRSRFAAAPERGLLARVGLRHRARLPDVYNLAQDVVVYMKR
jgi:hypothetical protein